jgi:hypothetical protein
MEENDAVEVRERGEPARARTFAQMQRRDLGRRDVEDGRVTAGLRILYAVIGLGGVVVALFIVAGWLTRGMIAVGAFALLYMAVAGRVPAWWGR